MKATEGNGGQPIKVSREPMRVPTIPRGLIYPPAARSLPGADRLTFEVKHLPQRAVLTYHDAQVISDGSQTAVQVFVGPHDVVTWEWL